MGKRIEHIDSIRAIAVLLMVMVHAAATWGPPATTQPTALVYVISGLGGLAAPLFVTVFGWGCLRARSTLKQRVVRAAFFFAAQTAINISSPHLFEPFTPGVLTLFGALILTQPLWLAPFLRWPQRNHELLLFFFSATLIFVTLFPLAQGPSVWNLRVQTSSISQWVEHALLTGTYPLFPWVLFASFGAWIGAQKGEERTYPHKPFPLSLAGGGLACCVLSLVYAQSSGIAWAAPTGVALLTFFPANGPFLVAALTGVGLVWLILQDLPINGLTSLSQRSLSIYLVHFIPIGLFHSVDEVHGFSLAQSMVVVLLYTVIWWPIANAWGRLAPRRDVEHALAWAVKR